ncbi:hypothetical protein [Streptomyces variegatus]|uniref:hypothetical protein n=1 Tax=Streptomyces variegatus TaxID=284040 RepID=UPI003C306431
MLIYNAAVLHKDTPTDGDDKGWADAFAVDVLGAKARGRDRPARAGRDGCGSLLFTGGGLALYPSPQYASLSASKAALCACVQTFHAQPARTGAHTTSVTIAGEIGSEAHFDLEVLAQAYLDLQHQPDSERQHELLRD